MSKESGARKAKTPNQQVSPIGGRKDVETVSGFAKNVRDVNRAYQPSKKDPKHFQSLSI